jgi:transcriptional regulator with XRE-family HTH domain
MDRVPSWIGMRIARLRKERGWAVRELGRKTGLAGSGLANIEAGNDFRISSAIALAEAFGVGLADLLAEQECAHCDGRPPAGFMCPECGRLGGEAAPCP